jgi:hypothetical protein
MTTMRCISLWQPWASLVATNWKHYETRSWSTPYRGPLAIHAAKRTEDLEYWFNKPEFRRYLVASGISWHGDLPLGAVVGVVNLVDVVRAEHIRHKLAITERTFGDFSDGRYAWKLEWVCRFTKPLPARGSQGIFSVDIPDDTVTP